MSRKPPYLYHFSNGTNPIAAMSSLVGVWIDVLCENRNKAPDRREQSGCVVYNDRFYVFGGHNGVTHINDFYEFNFARMSWRAVAATDGVPSARCGHTCVVYKDSLYVFGGRNNWVRFNDLIEYSFVTQQWSDVMANAGSAPAPNSHHSAVVHDTSMYCFGGSSGSDVFSDFHQFNFETRAWTPVRATGAVPQPRWGATLVVFENTCILFGGNGGSGALNDLHLFDFDQGVWSTIAVEGPALSRRYGHSAVVFSNAMYAFGGFADTSMANVHKLPLGRSESRKWEKVTSVGASRGECYYHTAAVYDSNLIVFGGRGNGNSFIQCRLEETNHTAEGSVLSYLHRLVNSELTSDITFIVEGAPIYAHSILCMRCDYFRAMLTSDMVESRSREVVISDVRHPTFLLFLEYLYTDNVDVAGEDTMELLVVADRFGADGLKKICERRILSTLRVENAAMILYAADQYHAAMLRDQCVSFILVNFDAVSKTPAFEEMSRINVDLVIELLKRR